MQLPLACSLVRNPCCSSKLDIMILHLKPDLHGSVMFNVVCPSTKSNGPKSGLILVIQSNQLLAKSLFHVALALWSDESICSVVELEA